MNLRTLLTVTLSGTLLASTALAQDPVATGDKPQWKLSQAYNAMGATSAEDFLGKPVLVDFWGTR
jgi:hypothetical protein